MDEIDSYQSIYCLDPDPDYEAHVEIADFCENILKDQLEHNKIIKLCFFKDSLYGVQLDFVSLTISKKGRILQP